MFGHTWLLGPLVCLMVAVASARPPECEQPPVWSIGRRQPLLEGRGKQASSLESLRQHFLKYGMDDLHFVIVNSNLHHSLLLKQQLDSRVSFEVFQDTEDKDIWKLLQGGKDDVYVYDRCGRLAYYIPFPLSIMRSSESLVPSAVLATYYRSPCGNTCENNGTQSLETYLDTIFDEAKIDNETITTTENYTTEQSLVAETTSTSLDTFLEPDNATMDYNDIPNQELYNFESLNDTIEHLDSNETSIKNELSFLNSILSIFFDPYQEDPTLSYNVTGTEPPEELYPETETTNYTLPDNETLDDNEFVPTNNETKTFPTEAPTTAMPLRKMPDPCAEAGASVCRNWSKRRLLRAQTCCSHHTTGHLSGYHHHEYCQHFSKKRCKKIQTILKCCVKTAMKDVAILHLEKAHTTQTNNLRDKIEAVDEPNTENPIHEINNIPQPKTNTLLDKVDERKLTDKTEDVTEPKTNKLLDKVEESKPMNKPQDVATPKTNNILDKVEQKEPIVIVCCKQGHHHQQLCRAVEGLTCLDGEYISENVDDLPVLSG